MSHSTKVKTKIDDKSCLIKALCDKGWKSEQILTEGGLVCKAYYSREDTEVDILIKNENLSRGSWGDLGFKKENGFYSIVIDGDNRKRTYNDSWFNDLKQRYTYHKVKKEAKRNGYKVYEKYVESSEGKRILQVKIRKY